MPKQVHHHDDWNFPSYNKLLPMPAQEQIDIVPQVDEKELELQVYSKHIQAIPYCDIVFNKINYKLHVNI